MLDMLAAGLAILAQIEAFRVITLVFLGCLIAAFAIIASQRDDNPVVFLSHDTISWACLKKQTEKNGPWRGVKLQYIQVL